MGVKVQNTFHVWMLPLMLSIRFGLTAFAHFQRMVRKNHIARVEKSCILHYINNMYKHIDIMINNNQYQ